MDRNWNKDPAPAKYDFTVVLPWYEERRLLLISSAGGGGGVFAALAFNRHRRLVRSYAEVEAKVALRTKQLERAADELLHSQKMNALGTLAAGIAHDFNNILSIIKGSAQIIEDNLDNPQKIRTRTDRIKTVVEQGAGIVKAMLGFSRGSGGEAALCDVNAALEETIKLLGRPVPARGRSPVRARDLPAAGSGLRDFIQQILLNFIFNAAEAMTGQKQVILTSAAGQLPAATGAGPGRGRGLHFHFREGFWLAASRRKSCPASLSRFSPPSRCPPGAAPAWACPWPMNWPENGGWAGRRIRRRPGQHLHPHPSRPGFAGGLRPLNELDCDNLRTRWTTPKS